MPRYVLAAVLVVFLALLACGKADPAATAKCATQGTGDDCGKCCKAEGRNGHRWINGKCECL